MGRSVEIEGLSRGSNPIPMGARVGPLVCSSGLMGADPGTGSGSCSRIPASEPTSTSGGWRCFPTSATGQPGTPPSGTSPARWSCNLK
jgi:hypothetical protein